MAKNKKELEVENIELKKRLKDIQYEIKDLQLQQKDATIQGEGLPSNGFGLFVSDNKYMIAKIKFDAHSREAKVTHVEEVGNNSHSHAFAHLRGEKELEILMRHINEE